MTALFFSNSTDLLSAGWLRNNGVRILIILAFAIGVSLLGRLAVRRVTRKLDASPSVTAELSLARAATLTNALSSTIRLVVWTMAILLVLGEVGIDLAPLLTGAGIAGVAVAFGAQSLMRDFLSGFFILFENQFGVGQIVDMQTTGGPVAGKIEFMTLRITTVRAFDGTVHIVPNGNIQVVGNKSRGWARAIVDVSVAYGEDVEQVREILEDLFEELRGQADLQEVLLSGPNVLGVETVGAKEVVIRVIAETRPTRRSDVERLLRSRIKQRLDERGVNASQFVPPPNASG
jgi:small-conductance mechanosensitive channel